jgi:pimeloyl-ACP methyl ester carboxylesterase
VKALLALLLALGAAVAQGQDHAREARWAAEAKANLVVGDAVALKLASGREFLGLWTEAAGAKPAILLVHGVGVHPDHGVIGLLRASLAEAGFPTLSIQMPVQASDAKLDDYYPKVFPEAGERIAAGAAWLRAKGAARVVLLSHSMGSWMSNVYFENTPKPPFAAWICMGLTGGFGGLGNVDAPILDVYGENDLPNVLRADWRRRNAISAIAGSRQVRIAGADHHYLGREKELAAEITTFVSGLK